MTWIKLPLKQITIAFTSTLAVVSSIDNFTSVQAQPTELKHSTLSISVKQNAEPPPDGGGGQPRSGRGKGGGTYVRFVPPPPSSAGTPRGRRSGGASRDDCPAVGTPLTALVPDNNLGLTIAESPTFWFFVPQLPATARSGEFVLQDEKHNDVYRTPFSLSGKPGVVSIRLPSNLQSSLKTDQMYRWYFRIYCQPQTTSVYFWVEGWVKQVALNPSLESQLEAAKPREYIAYAENGIWHEALTKLAELRLSDPQNATLSENWTQLLRAVDLEELAKEPLLGPVLPP
jgi:hypothetical protein